MVGPGASGGVPVKPEDVLGWTLVRTARSMAERFTEVFDAAGITQHQFGVLVRLSLHPITSQAALAREILVTPQSIGPILTRMEDLGLVRRSGPAGPGLPVVTEITPRGLRLLREVAPRVQEINRPEALGLDRRQAAELNATLHRVYEHLNRDR
jgi:DNA-binding MarR family transcriptional regulator